MERIKTTEELLLEETMKMFADPKSTKENTIKRLENDPALDRICFATAQTLKKLLEMKALTDITAKQMLAQTIMIWENTNNKFNEQLTIKKDDN